jgi:hypothetical protein
MLMNMFPKLYILLLWRSAKSVEQILQMSLLKFMPVQNKKVFAPKNRKTNEQIKKYM